MKFKAKAKHGHRIEILESRCRRCGRPISCSSRSICGANDLHKRLSGICTSCITTEEEQEILDTLASAIVHDQRQSKGPRS